MAGQGLSDRKDGLSGVVFEKKLLCASEMFGGPEPVRVFDRCPPPQAEKDKRIPMAMRPTPFRLAEVMGESLQRLRGGEAAVSGPAQWRQGEAEAEE